MEFIGDLFPRGESGYEEARRGALWNAFTPDRFPEIIVRAATEDDCVAAAIGAVKDLTPVQVTASQGTDDHLGVNRRVVTDSGTTMLPNREGPHDRDVDTLWFSRADDSGGSLLASLTVIACHPTSRGGSLIGGDYPGFLMREVERQTGGIALFLLGVIAVGVWKR